MIRRFALVLVFVLTGMATADTITHFEAVLTPDAVIAENMMPSAGMSSAFGTAQFVLTMPDIGLPTMSYAIQVEGIDFTAAQTPLSGADDLTALHFHDTTQCSSVPTNDCQMGIDTVGTEHVLNVAGFPRQDDKDADLIPLADGVGGMVTGLWDDGDEDLTFPPSNALSGTTAAGDAILDLLFDDLLFVNVHTNEFSLGEIGGYIRQVPEPSSLMLVICGLTWLLGRRR